MSRAMADHIRDLLMEARYNQSRREIIETEMSDDKKLDDVSCERNRWFPSNSNFILILISESNTDRFDAFTSSIVCDPQRN